MKYLYKYDSYIKENFFTKIIYKLFGKYIDKNYDANEKLRQIATRLADPRVSMPELILTGEIKAYNILIRAYRHFYPKEDLIEDCKFMMTKLQEDLWKDKQNYEMISTAIYKLNKFIEYCNEKSKFYDGDINNFKPLLNK